jgi:hypothetical protein
VNAPVRFPLGQGVPRLSQASLDALVAGLAEHVAAAVIERLVPLLERPQAPALLDRRGIAMALNCGLDTIDKLRAEGMPSLRVGDAPRFELEAVLRWLRERGSG